MTLTGSYVDAAEAEIYFDGDPRAEAFLGEDIEWYLKRATKIIDALPLRGRKYLRDGTQALQFPRIIDGVTCDWNDSIDLPIVPQAVKDACLEEALTIFSQGTGIRRDLQEQGVASYSIGGKLQETFRPGAGTENMLSSKARRIMRRYVGAEIR